MGVELLVDLVHSQNTDNWQERNQAAIDALFGGKGRYSERAASKVTLRAPLNDTPFAALIEAKNPRSGAYSGLSFVIFPVDGHPALFGLVVGTQGLTPDEAILGRPGHARKAQAIAKWLNRWQRGTGLAAWAKQDPTRTDLDAPRSLQAAWPQYAGPLDRYGNVMYAMYRPNDDREATRQALAAYLDLMFEERGQNPMAGYKQDAEAIRANWFRELLPALNKERVASELRQRRYAIVQGPPGTG